MLETCKLNIRELISKFDKEKFLEQDDLLELRKNIVQWDQSYFITEEEITEESCSQTTYWEMTFEGRNFIFIFEKSLICDEYFINDFFENK